MADSLDEPESPGESLLAPRTLSFMTRTIWRLEIRWILLSTTGLTAGLALGLRLAMPIQALVGMMLVTPVALAVTGSVLGASQAFATRRQAREAVPWIIATALGVAAGMTLGIVGVEAAGRALTGGPVRLVALEPLGRFLGLTLVGCMTGLAVGLAQRVSLRQRSTADGVRWLAATVIGFGLGLPVGGLAADVFVGGLGSTAGFGLFVLAAGLIVASATARGAARIFASPR